MFVAFPTQIHLQKLTRCDSQHKWSFQLEQLIKEFLTVVDEFLKDGRLEGFIAYVRTAQYFRDQPSQEDVLPRVK